MKYIVSTLGQSIDFKLATERNIVIDTEVPIAVSEEEYLVLESRLGSQIKVVESGSGVTETVIPEEKIEGQPEEVKSEEVSTEEVKEGEEQK